MAILDAANGYLCPMENKKTAIILGATGLVGSELLKLLLENEAFDKVILILRRSAGINHSKIVEQIIDFEQIGNYSKVIAGDVLFSSLGTTLKKAGSKEAQWKIDYTYQYEVAKMARLNGVKTAVLVSSANASSNSSIFYSRMKGQLEDDIIKLGFDSTCILQPSVLDGDRKEKRAGEKMAIQVGHVLSKMGILRKYRPIPAKKVAEKMIWFALAKNQDKVVYIKLDEIFKV